MLEAIDDGLLALGHSVRQAIYWRLESEYGLKRDDVADRLEDFVEALADMLGEGAKVLGRVMAKRLYAKLGLAFKPIEGYTLADYVKKAEKLIVGRR